MIRCQRQIQQGLYETLLTEALEDYINFTYAVAFHDFLESTLR